MAGHSCARTDPQGTVCRLADDSGAKTDYYTHAAFGQEYTPSGTTPNPYRFGGAWGYITDTPGSGLLQLGARFYWPEVGRFIQQDPVGEGMNWYLYGYDNPLVWVDPYGFGTLDDLRDWYIGGMGGISDLTDEVLLGGATQHFGCTAGAWDAGKATTGQLIGAAARWGIGVAGTASAAGEGLAAINRATAMSGLVTHFGPKEMTAIRPGDWVITGNGGLLNRVLTLKPFAYAKSLPMEAAPGMLQVPGGPLSLVHRVLGHRIYVP